MSMRQNSHFWSCFCHQCYSCSHASFQRFPQQSPQSWRSLLSSPLLPKRVHEHLLRPPLYPSLWVVWRGLGDHLNRLLSDVSHRRLLQSYRHHFVRTTIMMTAMMTMATLTKVAMRVMKTVSCIPHICRCCCLQQVPFVAAASGVTKGEYFCSVRLTFVVKVLTCCYTKALLPHKDRCWSWKRRHAKQGPATSTNIQVLAGSFMSWTHLFKSPPLPVTL